jgi:hypothetical protein
MAYLTAAVLKAESAWYFVAWQPVIADATAFDTWMATIVSRAANYVAWRVGSTAYATIDLIEQGILQEAELCCAQYYLLLASAALADTSDDSTLQPALQSGPKILKDAEAYRERCEFLLSAFAVLVPNANHALPVAGST